MSGDSLTLYKPIGLSLPNNEDLHTLLAAFSPQLANRYLVTGVVQCAFENSGQSTQAVTSYFGCEYIQLFHLHLHNLIFE